MGILGKMIEAIKVLGKEDIEIIDNEYKIGNNESEINKAFRDAQKNIQKMEPDTSSMLEPSAGNKEKKRKYTEGLETGTQKEPGTVINNRTKKTQEIQLELDK